MILYFIRIIHFLIICLILISPFINFYKLKEYVFIFLVYLLLQYLTGYEKCGLTELEYIFMGENYKEGFMYRIIKPMITMKEAYFNNYITIIHLVYIIILYYQLYN
jgi:hypothetical protein